MPFRAFIFMTAVVTGLLTSYSIFAEEEIYDRLDGTGPSHQRVDVIEWDGNLEIHTYPKGSQAGLSAKLDDRVEGKKVMVLGYRFQGQKSRLIRRAILGVPFQAKVLGYIDPSEKEFDKIAVTNQKLGAPWKEYKLDAAPAQWYPDGDERNLDDPAQGKAMPQFLGEQKIIEADRKPATAVKPLPKSEDSIEHFEW